MIVRVICCRIALSLWLSIRTPIIIVSYSIGVVLYLYFLLLGVFACCSLLAEQFRSMPGRVEIVF